jgi:hypothetical protein
VNLDLNLNAQVSMGCVNGKGCVRRRRRGPHQNPSSSHHVNSSRCQIITDPTTLGSTQIPSHGLLLQYSALSHRGHYPDSPERENQDFFLIKTQLLLNPNLHLFGVFDGHGAYGTQCARFDPLFICFCCFLKRAC